MVHKKAYLPTNHIENVTLYHILRINYLFLRYYAIQTNK